ncbi:MAG: YceI family protein [Rickettsiales bacterium]|nr:YceI family protein [Rickettsiales bacterium]
MKKLKLISLAIFASAFIAQNVCAEPLKYQIESNHANIVWFANHFGFSNQSGKFSDITGEIIFDEAKPEKSSVNVVIKIDSLTTGLPKFDAHLKSADFFNVKEFPTANFVSKKIKVTGKNKAKIEGDLTLHGVTKPVILDVKFNKSGVSVVTQKQTVGFSATTTIKRSEFGIQYAIPGVLDKVDLIIEAEANR